MVLDRAVSHAEIRVRMRHCQCALKLLAAKCDHQWHQNQCSMALYYFSTVPPLSPFSVIPHPGSSGTLLRDWKLTVSSDGIAA